MDLHDSVRKDLQCIPKARVGKPVKLHSNTTIESDDLTSEIERCLSEDDHTKSSSSSNQFRFVKRQKM